MPVFPVLCDSCGAVSFHPRLMAGTGTAIMTACRTNCPSCGSLASIADGQYTANEAMLTDPQQIHTLVAALGEIARLIAKQATPTEIQKTIDQSYPFLNYFNKFARSLSDLRKLVWTILALYALLSGHDKATVDIHVQEEIRDALRDISAKMNAKPPADQPQHQARRHKRPPH